MLSRRSFMRGLFIGLGALVFGGWQKLLGATGQGYYRIVVLGDPHLPVRVAKHPDFAEQQAILLAKNDVIADINSWDDVTAVVVVGDIVEQRGVKSEYDYIQSFFGKLKKELWVINGNHEFLYEDELSSNGRIKPASSEVRQQKLDAFARFWQLPRRWYAKDLGGYHLIFLSTEGPLPTQIGETQLAWFEQELAAHRDQKTLIFFHGPLNHTLLTYHKSVNTERSIAMPADKIDAILADNPQIKLWISGHTHTPCRNLSFANNEINFYNEHTCNIHNDCMDKKKITTNSIYLYPDHIEVRTFDHHKKCWLEEIDRSF